MAASSGRMDSCFSRGLKKNKIKKKSNIYFYMNKSVSLSAADFHILLLQQNSVGTLETINKLQSFGQSERNTSRRFPNFFFFSLSFEILTLPVLPVSRTFLLNHFCFWSILVCGPRPPLHHVQAWWTQNSRNRIPPPYFKWCQRGPLLCLTAVYNVCFFLVFFSSKYSVKNSTRNRLSISVVI